MRCSPTFVQQLLPSAPVALAVFSVTSAFAQDSAVALPAASAQEQSTPAAANVVQEVVVTGSRFGGRIVTDSPTPIDSLSAEDLLKGGQTELKQMLKAQVPSFNMPRPSAAGTTDFMNAPSLRGLSPGQVLLLVNGKRRHTSGDLNTSNGIGRGDVGYDFNSIPPAALARVEVLRDGAAAQYGSDAIAGVINLVLDRSEGAGVKASYGQTSENDGEVIDTSAWLGLPLGNGGVVRATVQYMDRELTNRARPDTRQQYFGSDGTRMPSGNFGSGIGLTPSNGTLDPREATMDRNVFRIGEPPYTLKTIFLNADLPVAETVTLYSFGGYSELSGTTNNFFRRPGQNETVRALYPDGFRPLIDIDIQNASLAAGLRGGDLSSLAWDFSTVFGHSAFDSDGTRSNNPSFGAGSATSAYLGGTRFEQWTTNLDVSKEFPLGQSEPLKVAAGLEYRAEDYELVAGEPNSYLNGGVPILDGPNAGAAAPVGFQPNAGYRPTDATKRDRNSKALYVELEKEFFGRWLLSGAGRFERYSDFGSSNNFKLATRLEISDSLALRGSVGTGFRAPNLAQSFFNTTQTLFISGVQTQVRLLPVDDPVARLVGATDLRPEESKNMSLGAVFESGDLSISGDVYQMEIDDRIAMSSNFQDPRITALLAANGFPGIGAVSYLTNAVDTTTRGIDLTARYRADLGGAGTLTTTLAANFNETQFDAIDPTPAPLSAIGIRTPLFDLTQQIRFTDSQPRSKVILGLAWQRNDLSVNLTNTYYGKVAAVAFTNLTPAQIAALTPGYDVSLRPTDPASSNSQVIQYFKAKIITDLEATYRLNDRLSLSAGVNNAFDVYPEENIASTPASVAAGVNGSDNAGTIPYNAISPFGFSGRFYYMSAAYGF